MSRPGCIASCHPYNASASIRPLSGSLEDFSTKTLLPFPLTSIGGLGSRTATLAPLVLFNRTAIKFPAAVGNPAKLHPDFLRGLAGDHGP